jgi:hypothetical protein
MIESCGSIVYSLQAPAFMDRLQTLLAVAILGACLWTLAMPAARGTVVAHPRFKATAELYSPGNVIRLSGVDFGAASLTLVIVAQRSCVFCRRSMPFYDSLASDLRGGKGSRRIVMVSVDPVDMTRRYLESSDVVGIEVAQVPIAELRVPATPTILIVKASGMIEDLWVGQQDPKGESEIRTRFFRN